MAYNWNNPVDFSSGFGADTQGQFKDITSFLPAKQGGNMLLAPLAAPLITGLFSAGSSMFGANKAEEAARRSDNTSKQIAQAQLDAQRAGILESRELAKGNLGFGMWDKVFSAGTGADLDFGRQQKASLFQRNILDPLSAANERDDLRAKIGIEGSSAVRGLRQEANREALKRTLAEKQGQMMGMFGRIAPIDTSTLFT
jgi:hypothetical protein